jgi:Uncharacterized protein conserved in bacteria (DUF2188)
MILPLEVPMVSSNNRHVVPNPNGGSDVKAPGAKRASARAPTQAQAERRAKEIVSNQGGGEVRIHGRDGRIRDSDTIARAGIPTRPATRGTEQAEAEGERCHTPPAYSASP